MRSPLPRSLVLWLAAAIALIGDLSAADQKKPSRLPSFPGMRSIPGLRSLPGMQQPEAPKPASPQDEKEAQAEPSAEPAPSPSSPSLPSNSNAAAADTTTTAATPATAAPATTATAGTQLALVSVPALPPGVDLSYQPVNQPRYTLPDPEQAAREEAQRAQELAADLRTIGPIADLPAVGSAEFTKLRTDALRIVQRRFEESRARLESDAESIFTANINWTPNFSSAPRGIPAADRQRALAASADVAYAINHLDRPRFVLAYAAAIFALDPDSALGAENAASAILASGERLYPTANDVRRLQAYRADAAVVYRYALACSVDAGKWTHRSLGILINLGSLYVDMRDAARARPLLLAARAFAPDSWDVARALAACYEMQGRSALARAALEDKRVAPPAMYGALRRMQKNLNDTIEAAELGPSSSDEELEAAMQKLDTQQILTAADFVESIDPAERERARQFVDQLSVQGSFRAPEIDGLTQYSTLESISRPLGRQSLAEFSGRLGSYGMFMLARMMSNQNDHLARLGINIEYDVNINDVMANPKRYKDRQINATVTGADRAQLQARAEQMRQQALQAQRELESGQTDTLLQIGASIDPALAIYQLRPLDFANPTDVMIQQYNISMLGRKMNTYNSYFFAVSDRTRKALEEIGTLYAGKYYAIKEQERTELEILARQIAAAGPNANLAQFRLMEHNIHMTYAPQYNAAADFAWKQATQVAAKAYAEKIKPRAERFYYDTFRHIALISDPVVRERKNREFEQILYSGVYRGLLNVLTAFGSYEHVDDWDCGCDVGDLQAQAQREKDEREQLKFETERRGKLQFLSGEIPPSSPLFQKLDAYGTDIEWGFGFKLKGRVSAARSTLSIEAQLPTALTPKLTYSFTESAFTGATTHGGSLAVNATLTEGTAKLAATLSMQGSVSIDGKGVLRDYAVTAASSVNFGMGPTTYSAGGEIGYSSQGGLTSDVKAGISSSISDTIGGSTTVAFEVSARRGTTFTAKAERSLNPWASELNKDIKEATDPLSLMFPIDTSVKVPIWSGKFTL